jgi:polyisoprenoid-binding protein YceI
MNYTHKGPHMTAIETTPTLTPGKWTIEPAHSEVAFSVRHLGLTKVNGRFNSFSGTVTIADDLSAAAVEATIDLSSVDTNNANRDGHLQSGDFFNAETHPVMTFTSSSTTGDAMIGDLTIAGITKTVELDVEFHGVAVDGYDTIRAGFSASGKINRSDFGITFNAPLGLDGALVSDAVKINLEIQAVPVT